MAFSPGPFCSIQLWLWSLLARVTTYLRAVLTSNGGQMILESSAVPDSLQKWIQPRTYRCRTWARLLRRDGESGELRKKWVGGRIKDQIDVPLKGSLNCEVPHSNLIRLKRASPRKEPAFCVTRDGVYLKESLFLVLLCGEASQVYVKVRKLLRLRGLALVQKVQSQEDSGTCGPVRKEPGPSEVRAVTRSVDSAGQGPPLAGAICCYLPSWNYFYIESSRIFRESCRGQQPRTWALPLLVAWPWASYLDCQALRFFTYQRRMGMCTSQDYGEK